MTMKWNTSDYYDYMELCYDYDYEILAITIPPGEILHVYYYYGYEVAI